MADFLQELRDLCGYRHAFEEKKKQLTKNSTNEEFAEVIILFCQNAIRREAMCGNRWMRFARDIFTIPLEHLWLENADQKRIFMAVVGAVKERLRNLGVKVESSFDAARDSSHELFSYADWAVFDDYTANVMY